MGPVLPSTLEIVYGAVLLVYVALVVFAAKPLYHYMRGRGLAHNVAVYYNRKFIHVFGGGVVALLVPLLFTTPLIPFAMALVLALITYYPHRTGKLMYWFQVEENMYEVNFVLAWGASLLLVWLATESLYLAVLPALLISFGDAVTGVVRNALFQRRTKHWTGNLAMLLVSIPIGYAYAGLVGLLAGVVASIVEHYELPPIDDNVLIALSTLAILLAGYSLDPSLVQPALAS